MISRLETTLSLAMLAFIVSSLAEWATAAQITGAAVLVLACDFTIRVGVRRARGAGWNEAWGRVPREDH